MSALVIDGHPDARSLTAALAQRYAEGHGDARVLALRDLEFDPHLRFGYRERMTLEPDLVDAKRALSEADTVVVATPLWWGSVPAVLKGFFDRALLPQQEYRYTKLGLPEGLLPARRGRPLRAHASDARSQDGRGTHRHPVARPCRTPRRLRLTLNSGGRALTPRGAPPARGRRSAARRGAARARPRRA
jgi:hypothetical protein